MNRTRRILAAALAGVLAIGLAACAPATDADERLTIGLTYTPNIQFAPFYVAEELGYFDEGGVEVELRHHGESEGLFTALEEGTEQLVYASGDEIMQAGLAHAPITSVATIYTSYPAALIVPADSPITTAADLRGRTIGIPGPYGSTWLALNALLVQHGLTTEDVTVQHIGYTQQAALTTGKVDAVMGYVNNDVVQFEAGGFSVRVIDAVDPHDPLLVGPAIAASRSVVAERPDDVRKVLAALVKAIDYIAAHPKETVDLAAAYIPTLTTAAAKDAALATLKASIPLMTPDATQPLRNDPEVWEAMCAFLSMNGFRDGAGECATTYTNDLLP